MKQTGLFAHATSDSALLSDDGVYRYRLSRSISTDESRTARVLFVCLNPSTADAATDDATTRKLKGFSDRWRMRAYTLVNLFAFRATDPVALKDRKDPVGPLNWGVVRDEVSAHGKIVLAWGSHAPIARMVKAQSEVYVDRIRRTWPWLTLFCLGRCADGSPRHPLMLSYDTPLEVFR